MAGQFEQGEMVLVRHGDGLLWPAIITQLNEGSAKAEITHIYPDEEEPLDHPLNDVVFKDLIYKFPPNIRRVLQEAQQATFGPMASAKDHYIGVLQYAIDHFEKTFGASKEEDGPDIARLPVLSTGSPPPPDRHDVRTVRPFPNPESYGIPINLASARGIRRLYFVMDRCSATKLANRFGDNLPPDVGIVCEDHPQWLFNTHYKFEKHWVYVHILPQLPPDDDDAEPVGAG